MQSWLTVAVTPHPGLCLLSCLPHKAGGRQRVLSCCNRESQAGKWFGCGDGEDRWVSQAIDDSAAANSAFSLCTLGGVCMIDLPLLS